MNEDYKNLSINVLKNLNYIVQNLTYILIFTMNFSINTEIKKLLLLRLVSNGVAHC